MTDGWRNCLLQVAIWELSTSAAMKPSAAVKQETRERGGGWWDLLPRQSGSCVQVLLGAPGWSLTLSQGWILRRGHCISPCLGFCFGPVLQCIIYLDVMQSCPFLYYRLCRVLMFGLFFLPPIIPETWIDNFVPLTTVSSGWSTTVFPLCFSFCHHPATRSLYPSSLFKFFSWK